MIPHMIGLRENSKTQKIAVLTSDIKNKMLLFCTLIRCIKNHERTNFLTSLYIRRTFSMKGQ